MLSMCDKQSGILFLQVCLINQARYCMKFSFEILLVIYNELYCRSVEGCGNIGIHK